MKLNELTLTKAIQGLKHKKFSLRELYADVDNAYKKNNPKYNIYLAQNKKALIQAEQRSDLALGGVPIAVKDNFCTKGLATTASSTVLDGFLPQFESTVTHKLQEAGGVIYGKTNMDAWAHGSSTETSQYGRTLNPRNPEYLPGGSSGGSAAAVAADLCLGALGSETAGSIRQPAAWCGCVGLKPTYGRVSRYGVVAMASSTDSPGPIAKTVEDAALLLNAIAGVDSLDATSSGYTSVDFTVNLGKQIKNLKIGVLYHDLKGLQNIWSLFEPALKVLEDLGCKVEYVKAMDPKYAVGVYTVVQRAEVSSNLAGYNGIRYDHGRSKFGDEARRRIILGTFSLAKGYADQYYQTAQKVRRLFMEDFEKLFQKYDLLVSLTSPGFAKKVGASQGEAMFGELEDMLLEPSSIAGLPGINLPTYRDPQTNLYLGINIIAPKWQEAKMIGLGDMYEQATAWNSWRKKHE